ncbi:unnamed protein product [Laminaria digitata]
MQRFLVTGANKGIGLAVVKSLLDADKTAFVFLGSRDVGRGQDAVHSLITENSDLYSGRVEAIQIDVSDAGSVSRAADIVRTCLGGGGSEAARYLDVLFNNAGVAPEDFAPSEFDSCMEVNYRGVVRTTEAFLPLLNPSKGRIVMTSSSNAPSFVVQCSAERQAVMANPAVTRADIAGLLDECLAIAHSGGDDIAGKFAAVGLSDAEDMGGYGLSKALLNMYTMQLARENPSLLVNACTPGLILTDLGRQFEKKFNVKLDDVGAKPPLDGAEVLVYLATGDVDASGWYFGSDKQRSPLDRYRGPGDPAYDGK